MTRWIRILAVKAKGLEFEPLAPIETKHDHTSVTPPLVGRNRKVPGKTAPIGSSERPASKKTKTKTKTNEQRQGQCPLLIPELEPCIHT